MDGRISRMHRPISLAHMAFHDIPLPCDATPPDEMHPDLTTPDGVYPPDRDSGTIPSDSYGTSNRTCDDPPSPFTYEHRARTRKVIRKPSNVSDENDFSKPGPVFETDYIYIRKKDKKVNNQKKSIVKLRRLGLARQRLGEKYARTLSTMSKIKTHSGGYLEDYFNNACTMHHSVATGIIAPNTNVQKSDPDNSGAPSDYELLALLQKLSFIENKKAATNLKS